MTSILFPIVLASMITITAYMTFWFLVSLALKRNDVADFAWGIGFIIVSLVPLALLGTSARGALVITLVTLWGIRLSTHVLSRNRHKPEDPRYTEWRKKWGTYQRLGSFLQVFFLQGILLCIIAAPVMFIGAFKGGPFGIFDAIGLAVWIIGFFFESVGDAQLKKFIANPENKGKLMTSGLWRYTRHPNYFGEATMWWGIWIIALSVPFGFWSIIGPIAITSLLTLVSGVPLVEKAFAEKPGFDEYKRTTSVFIPWFPRKSV